MASTVSPALPIAGAPPAVRTRLARFDLATFVFGVLMVVALVTRLALLAYDWRALDATRVEILEALLVGAVFDALASLWIVAPLVLAVALLPDRAFAWRFTRGWLRFWMFFLFALSAFVIAAEVLFFDEFNGRFNFVAVDYLIFPTEVVTNLWESYPLPAILLGVGAAGFLTVWLARRRIAAAIAAATPGRTRLAVVAAFGAALGGLTFGVTPEMGKVSDDRALNEIAMNGYYTFWMAFLGQDAPYEGLYATRPLAEETARIRALVVDRDRAAGRFTPLPPAGPLMLRGTAAEAEPTMAEGAHGWSPERPTERRVVSHVPETRRNVVVVLEESLGSIFLASLHPRGDTVLTPRFDSLIAEGTVLANAYSTGNRTIRALEATTSSLPPLPGISIVRRPASRDLFTLPAVLRERGYATSFIYGGRALFDGMGAYMRNNGMDLVVEQKDYPRDAFTTAWGVADEFIFDKALATYDSLHATGKPFYSLVLSVSNHKPYSYPAGRIAADPNARKRTHAVMYADWALGRFVRMAKSHPWFDSTLFVLMGDHGARVYGASEIPLPSYEVPILFYAPGFIPAGQRITTLASTMDLPATIMARLGMTYDSRWFGHDVFGVPPEAGRALMTHNTNIALMRGDKVAVLGLKGATTVYAYDKAARRLREVASPDSSERELVEDAIAYFHTADRLYRSGAFRINAAK